MRSDAELSHFANVEDEATRRFEVFRFTKIAAVPIGCSWVRPTIRLAAPQVQRGPVAAHQGFGAGGPAGDVSCRGHCGGTGDRG